MKLFDAHIHVSLCEQGQDLIQRGQRAGVHWHLAGGYESSDWVRQFQLKKEFPGQFFTSVGIHPWKVIEAESDQLEIEWGEFLKHCESADFVGELGLDRHIKPCPEAWARQVFWFEKQLVEAKRQSKPLVLHCVKAYEATLEMLKSHGGEWRGIVHGFSGPLEVAKQFIDLGFFISIGAGVLNPNFKNLRKTVEHLDLRHLVYETDQPIDLNHPVYDEGLLKKVMESVAKMKSVEVDQVNEHSLKNLRALIPFGEKS